MISQIPNETDIRDSGRKFLSFDIDWVAWDPKWVRYIMDQPQVKMIVVCQGVITVEEGSRGQMKYTEVINPFQHIGDAMVT